MGKGDAVKYWEVIADKLSKAGWSWGCVATVDSSGRTIWIADAHRGAGKRYVVRADEKLTAFVELESEISRATIKHFARAALGRNPSEPCEKFRVRPNFEVFCNRGLLTLFQTMCLAATAGFTRCGEAGAWGSVLIHKHRTGIVPFHSWLPQSAVKTRENRQRARAFRSR
jgi:hypothetical protein